MSEGVPCLLGCLLSRLVVGKVVAAITLFLRFFFHQIRKIGFLPVPVVVQPV